MSEHQLDLDFSGNRLRLWPVTPNDHQFLYWLATCEFNNHRWRYRGQVPPFEGFVSQLHADVLAQFVVREIESGEPVGQAVAYGADLKNRHAYVGALVHPEKVGEGYGDEILKIFVPYLFRSWDLHKVFAEVPEFTFAAIQPKEDRLGMGSRLFELEAVLKDFLFFDGRMWDMYYASTTRERVEQVAAEGLDGRL